MPGRMGTPARLRGLLNTDQPFNLQPARQSTYHNLKAIPRILGVACLLLSQLAFAQTTEALTLSTITGTTKTLPDYLVIQPGSLPFDEARIRELEQQGKLSEAIKLVEMRAMISSNTDGIKTYNREAFRLTALKREFSTTAPAMLKEIQERIPDATQSDLEKWTADRSLYWMPIDGEIRYFRREPGILFRFNEEAKARAEAHDAGDPAAKKSEAFSFTGHMKAALDAARDTGSSTVLPVRFKVKHTVTVKPGKLPAGETIRCWMPYPRTDVTQQSAVQFISSKPLGKISDDSESRQRTVYFEQPAEQDGSARFELNFEYTCSALVPDLTRAKPELSAAERQALASDLQSRPPHLELTDEITSLARSIVGSETAVVEKARLIWRHLDQQVKWCPEMEYAVITNIVDKVLSEDRGDCGTQALAFIALCRAVDVPARWQSGWVMRPGSWNLHDWAEFYAPGIGWVPADPSVGSQEHADPAVREFLFGHVDAYRMIANSDYAVDFNPPKTHHRSDPIDNQRGEVEWDGGNLYFDDWAYNVDVEVIPSTP